MTYYDEEFHRLQAQCSRERQLTARISELTCQRTALTRQVEALQAVMKQEQRDVEKLEEGSLTAFFYHVIGKMDERLTKEQEEAYAARVKYDTAARELADIEDDLQRSAAELYGLRGCHERYQALLKEKAAIIKSQGGAAGDEIFRLEERLSYLRNQQKELAEAKQVGFVAQTSAQSVLESLNSAEGWGTWDLFGGGLIADIAKHNRLDEAQYAIDDLQVQLRRFKTELADVTIRADMKVTVEGFLHFADYFFDGLFADWAVLDHIHQSQDQILKTIQDIETVLDQLGEMMKALEEELFHTQEKLNLFITDVKIKE